MRKFFLCFGCCLCYMLSYAQVYYYVQFTDKNNSSYSISNPEIYLSERAILRRTNFNIPIDESDFPVNRNYLDTLTAHGAQIIQTTKWINGATILVTDTALVMPYVRQLPFVSYVQKTKDNSTNAIRINRKFLAETTADSINYGTTWQQIEMLQLHKLHALGFSGAGKHIAVIDNGFQNADTITAFDSIRPHILGTYNFVDRQTDVYTFGSHGTAVLSCMGGYLPNVYTGTALGSSYWLFHTEEDSQETLLEIDNWIAAAELADSLGADIITSSLGYSTFDDVTQNFTYADMNGRTARNSIAATMAARKGILVFIAAGNEGQAAWQHITTPSDADSVICVGSVTADKTYSPFSSIGPAADGRVKPTLCTMGSAACVVNSGGYATSGNGTSFAAPIMAGAAASLWSALPQLSNMQIYDLLIQNASLYSNPTDSLGYGIPNVYEAYIKGAAANKVLEVTDLNWFPNPATDQLIIKSANVYELQILNVQGQTVCKKRLLQGSNQLDVSCLPSGIYIMRFTNADTLTAGYFIKK